MGDGHRCLLRCARAGFFGVALTFALAAGSSSADSDSEAVRGYNGSGAPRGYNGSGAPRGYNGSGAPRGYNGSGAPRGYNGSGAPRGYNGSGAPRGYNGSGAPRGYNGSGAPRDYESSAACENSFGAGFAVAVIGPIDAVSSTGNTSVVHVLGQNFETPADESLHVGDYVVAAADPAIGVVVYHVGAPYVPGVSPVKIKAPVTAVNSSVGNVWLGEVVVDFTELLALEPSFSPQLDDSLEVAGVQPARGGIVLAGPSDASQVRCTDERM